MNVREFLSKNGRKGAKTTNSRYTKAQRSEWARKGAEVTNAKRKANKNKKKG